MTETNAAERLLIVGSYAAADQPGIQLLRVAETTGALTTCGTYAGIANPSFVVVHPNAQWVYAVSETRQGDGSTGSVWALHLDRESLALRPLNQQASGGDGPCHLQLDHTGRWILASNYTSGSIAVLPIQENGALGSMTERIQHAGSSAHPERQRGPHAHSSIFTPDNRYAIIADLGLDQLVAYAFDSATGKLRPHGRTTTKPGAGPRHMAFHPRGDHLYVANELDNTVSVYSYDAARCTLDERQTIPILPAGGPENLTAHIYLSPSGQQLYVSNRGPNTIAVFAVAADGQIAPAAIHPCGGDWPRHFTLLGERYLLVANQYSGDVSVLSLLAKSETFGSSLASVNIPQATCVQWVADNHGSAYAAL